ncbi:MAG: hypothetical protein ACLBM3_02375 [Dolichospermum sp.]|jgi:hypothetical protein
MFADLERYKSLERDLSTSSIVNQFSGLVYVPAITYPSFQNTLQTAGAVTINVDNATCTIQGSATIYPAYFIPGYTTESASLAGNYNNVITSNSGSTVPLMIKHPFNISKTIGVHGFNLN